MSPPKHDCILKWLLKFWKRFFFKSKNQEAVLLSIVFYFPILLMKVNMNTWSITIPEMPYSNQLLSLLPWMWSSSISVLFCRGLYERGPVCSRSSGKGEVSNCHCVTAVAQFNREHWHYNREKRLQTEDSYTVILSIFTRSKVHWKLCRSDLPKGVRYSCSRDAGTRIRRWHL